MENISIVQSQKINDYKPILKGLVNDFELEYYTDILIWCKILDDYDLDKFWQVFIIKQDNQVIGICGFYSLYPNSTEELWLGWFGIVPYMRNQGVGQYALNWMKKKAKEIGCKRLMSYVGEDGQPLKFYHRNGFQLVSTVRDYLLTHPELTIEDFGDENYYIIECNL